MYGTAFEKTRISHLQQAFCDILADYPKPYIKENYFVDYFFILQEINVMQSYDRHLRESCSHKIWHFVIFNQLKDQIGVFTCSH